MYLKKKLIKQAGLFVGGVLFGTAGVSILSSKEAKKVYTNVVAAGLRAKDCTMNVVEKVQENFGDVVEEAKDLNEARNADKSEEDSDN